jgi:hypothetical protein
MGDTRQHGKLGFAAQAKRLAHPGEEMRQAVMSTLDTLGNTGTARGEGQGRRGIGTEDNTSGRLCELLERLEDIGLARVEGRTGDAVGGESDGRYEDSER